MENTLIYNTIIGTKVSKSGSKILRNVVKEAKKRGFVIQIGHSVSIDGDILDKNGSKLGNL